MTTTTFDSLGYFEKLKSAGVPEEQAKVQATALREQLDAQNTAVQRLIESYDESSRKELATKGDIQDTRLEIEKVRAELKTDIEKIRAEMEKVRAELKTDMKSLELRLLKWQLGIGLALAAIMAKGFDWIGFVN